jgi:hypothetical protein
MPAMRRFAFELHVPAQDYLRYYRGDVRSVMARCVDGRTLQFPATLLTPFVSSSGVHGSFVLICDDNGQGAQLQRQ